MRLEQTIRLHRKLAERQLMAIHVLGRWPRSIRKVSLFCLRRGFAAKRDQVRGMVNAGVPPDAAREYAQSNVVVF